MKAFLILLLFSSLPAFAGGFSVIDGTCRPESAGWCHCEVRDEYGGRHAMSLQCGILSCEHFRSGEAPVECSSATPPQAATCVLANAMYGSGGQLCLQPKAVATGQSKAQACGEVLECLNDFRCVQNYCRSTPIRGNWSLIEVR